MGLAALFYSLIESAKLAGVEPRAYLKEATLRAVRNPGTVTLPGDLKSVKSRENHPTGLAEDIRTNSTMTTSIPGSSL